MLEKSKKFGIHKDYNNCVAVLHMNSRNRKRRAFFQIPDQLARMTFAWFDLKSGIQMRVQLNINCECSGLEMKIANRISDPLPQAGPAVAAKNAHSSIVECRKNGNAFISLIICNIENFVTFYSIFWWMKRFAFSLVGPAQYILQTWQIFTRSKR